MTTYAPSRGLRAPGDPEPSRQASPAAAGSSLLHRPATPYYLLLGASTLLLVLGLVTLTVVARLVRRGWRRWKARDQVNPAPPAG